MLNAALYLFYYQRFVITHDEVYELGFCVGNFIRGFAVVDPDGGGDVVVFAQGVDDVDSGLDLAGAVDVGIGYALDHAVAGFFDAAIDEGVEHPELDETEFAVDPGFNQIHSAAGIGIHGKLLFFEVAYLGGKGFFKGQEFVDTGFSAGYHIEMSQGDLKVVDFGLELGFLLFEGFEVELRSFEDLQFEVCDLLAYFDSLWGRIKVRFGGRCGGFGFA